MAITIADTYYIKALDNYPYNLEEMLENVNYALSYDNEHPEANTLMARFYTHEVPKYDLAKEYAQRALASDPSCIEAFKALAIVLTYSGELQELKKVVGYVSTLREANKYYFEGLLAQAYEEKGKLNKSKKILKNALQNCVYDSTIESLQAKLDRVKKKLKRVRN